MLKVVYGTGRGGIRGKRAREAPRVVAVEVEVAGCCDIAEGRSGGDGMPESRGGIFFNGDASCLTGVIVVGMVVRGASGVWLGRRRRRRRCSDV